MYVRVDATSRARSLLCAAEAKNRRIGDERGVIVVVVVVGGSGGDNDGSSRAFLDDVLVLLRAA